MFQAKGQTLSFPFPSSTRGRRVRPATVSGLPWRRRYQLSLRVTDTVTIVATVLLSTDWILKATSSDSAYTQTITFAIAVSIGWLVMMSMFRTRDPRLIGVGAAEYKRVVQASAATFSWMAVVVILSGGDNFRYYLLVTFPAGLLGLLGSRWIWRKWLTRQRQYGMFLSKVVVVGRNDDVQYVVKQLSKKTGAVYEVVGAVLEGKSRSHTVLAGDRFVPVVYGLSNVEHSVAKTGADAVIVAGHLHKGSKYIRELGWRLERSSTELVLASTLTNVAGPRIQMRPVEGLPLMHVEMPQFTGGRHVVKRLMDVVLSGLALIVLAPVFIVVALLIRRDSPGPVFFKQERVGRGSGRFPMYKFRSMVVTAEADLAALRDRNEGNGVLFKMRHDPRVTKVGGWLRKYSIDELPQLYNVLRGDMALVGPRPPLASEVSGYDGHTHRRLLIKPGLTGLWQISGRSDLDWAESVRLDLYYVENWSVTGDFMIMWRTFKVMIRPVGAY
ncbi:sugar transferase [Arthrobacter sp. Bz4]|uniref:sugar transferase n=1 Tax=unclassified Arthrobacter TaxID=235627 RepID=UPI000A04BDC3|nr:sugar transferase [Arthrobacter sp. Bz4]PVE18498.1 sugar transferase [Arthrobacter sp. Bz4]